jgi:transposase
MKSFSTYVGLDVHKKSITVAVASAETHEPARSLGRVANDVPRLLRKLRRLGPPATIRVCYEAGPTGYGLHRRLVAEGYSCDVVAPSKTPKKSGDRVKTDRRDATKLAHFLRSGDLTVIRVPTPEEEALRDLVRAREDAKQVETNTKRRLGSLLLRHGRIWPKQSHWTKEHLEWVSSQSFEHPATTEAHAHYLGEVHRLRETLDELDRRIAETAQTMERADLIRALPVLKGIKVFTASAIVADVGDLRRFPSPGQFMSFLGLTPSESSSGDTRRRGSITKAGNTRVRRLLVEAAWSYWRHPHISRDLQKRLAGISPRVREIAWEAQKRLHRRLKRFAAVHKEPKKATVAVARELAGFIWALGQEEQLIETPQA